MSGWSGIARCHSRCVGLAIAKHVMGSCPIKSVSHSPNYAHALRPSQATRSQQQRRHRCHSSNTPEAKTRKIDPPDVRELAKMAHISVTDEEVMQRRFCILLSSQCRRILCIGCNKGALM